MTREEIAAYQRGYEAGLKRSEELPTPKEDVFQMVPALGFEAWEEHLTGEYAVKDPHSGATHRSAKASSALREAIKSRCLAAWWQDRAQSGEWQNRDDSEPSQPEAPKEDVLLEAHRITTGARNDDYGDPREDLGRTGRIWGAILGVADITAEKVALCMVGLKMSRQVNKPKRDNAADGAGYFRLAHICAGEPA